MIAKPNAFKVGLDRRKFTLGLSTGKPIRVLGKVNYPLIFQKDAIYIGELNVHPINVKKSRYVAR